MAGETYAARPIKRARRTKAQIEQLNRQICDVLAEDHPQSVRHCFYRLTDPRLPEPVEKSQRGYNQVQHRLVKLREDGVIPYGWITDATRRGYFTPTYRGAGDFLRSMAVHYRGDLWRGCGYLCEVWVESRSIAGVIQDDCEDLAVSLYPSGGFTSKTLAFEAAGHINATHAGRTVAIFYVGDYDPAGVLIDRNIEQELRRHLHHDVDLVFERIGITPEQIETLDLPSKPRKASEKRAPEILRTVEAEAMPAQLMRALLRGRIEALLPEHALATIKIAEEDEKAHLRRIADMLGNAA